MPEGSTTANGSSSQSAYGAGARLLVIDSGIGGLSVLGEIRKALPGATVAYLADNAAFPYGDVPGPALVARIGQLLAALLPIVSADAVVIACNTASTIALPTLRSQFSVPFVGCVPAIKPAGALSRTRSIGLLATPATVCRNYTQALIEDFAPDCRVVRVGARGLARMAEDKLRGRPIDLAVLREETRPLFEDDGERPVDTVVLGCTHYWFLLEELRAIAPPDVTWLDSGTAIARRVCAVLSESRRQPANPINGLPEDLAIFTALPDGAEALQAALHRFGLGSLKVLDPSPIAQAAAG